MARSTSTPSSASGGGGGSSKKRKAPTTTPATPSAAAAASSSSSSTATAKKKSKRESLEESRAKARAWAEEEKRKRRERASAAAASSAKSSTPSTASGKRSAPTPSSARRKRGAVGSRTSTPSTSDAEMEEAEEEEEDVGASSTSTARTTPRTKTSTVSSRTTPTTGTVTVKKSRTPGTATATAAAAAASVKSPPDSTSKKEKLLAAKERARQWAVRENIVKPKHIKSPPQPTVASSATRRTTTPRRPPPVPPAPASGNGNGSSSAAAAYVVLSDDEEDVEEESPPSPAQKISHILTGEGRGGARGTTTATIPVDDDGDSGPKQPQTVLDAASAAVVPSLPKTEEVEDREDRAGSIEGRVSGETGKFLERAERAYRIALSILRLTVVAVFLGCALYAWSVVYGNVARQMRRSAEDGILMGGTSRLHRHGRAPKYCYLDSSTPGGAVDKVSETEVGDEEGGKDEEEDGVQKCARTKPYPPVVPCPPRGVCRDGEWIECHPSSLFVKDVDAGVCSLTDDARTQLGQAEMVLSRWTGQSVCGAPKGEEVHRKGHRRHDDGGRGGETLWFDLNDLATEILVLDQQSSAGKNGTAVPTSSFPDRVSVISDILVTIISHLYEDKSSTISPTLKLSPNMDEVALTETGMATVDYPWACWSLIWLRHLTKSLLGWTWRRIASLAALCVAQPKASAAFVVMAYLVFIVLRRRRRKARLRADTEEAKAIAYEKLVGVAENDNGNKPEPYPVLHLKMDVANDMYPHSRKDREGFFSQQVWPRVLVEMRSDVRIEKRQVSVGPTPQECWVWLGNKGSSASTPASSSRRERGGWTGRLK